MFKTTIDMDTLNEIEEFLNGDYCDFVQSMNNAGLSFGAMAFTIDAIIKAVANAKDKLNEKCED